MSKKDKPVMVAARIAPKLQYGLRLLSRIHGGSIQAALEWAVNLALRRTKVGPATFQRALNELVDDAWAQPSEPRRIHVLNKTSPELLDFEERAAWHLVLRCPDLVRRAYFIYVPNDDNSDVEEIEVREIDREHANIEATVPKFDEIEPHWERIKEVGVALSRAGEIDNAYSLKEILNGDALKRARIA